MAGRGRGRGNISRWDPSFDGRVIASVTPLKKNTSQTVNKVDSLKSMLSSVRVTCIIDVNHFWAQLGSTSDLERFDNYMFALNRWCDNQIPSSLNDMPSVGQVVCVQHAASRMWRRAEVTRLSQRMVDVFFLDYGEAECVSLDMLCSNVPSDITSWPPQALYCTLDGVQPPEGEDQWSEKSVKRFSDLVFGQNLAASHENGSLKLTLYLVDDGGLKSVGSVLVEEGLAQESNYGPRGDNAWPQAPVRKPPQNKDNQQLKNLDNLEQQLVMSGFSYLLNPCNNIDQKPANEYTYETTTISSSYCTYKGNKESPVVTSSSSVQNFAPIKERSPQSHLSNRPHLASPGEFMTSHKPPNYGKEQASGIIQEDNQSRQSGVQSNPGTEDNNGHPHHNPWYSAWPQNDWKLPQDKNTQLFGTNDAYLGDTKHQSLGDLPFQDTKKNTSALQYHLNGPSAFHDPKYKQQPLMGPFEVPVGDVFRSHSNPQPREMKEPIAKPQPSTNNSQEKNLKTELSWQKWKFQRNIKRLFDKTDCDAYDIGLEIATMINNSKLSQDFEGVSEVMMVVEMITERVLDKDDFGSMAAKICSSLTGQEIPQFTRYLCEVITAIRDDLLEHLSASDWQERCERYCSFIGEMVLIAASQDRTDSSYKSVVDLLTRQSLETWLAFDQVNSEEKLEGFVVCLTGLLTVIGPVMEEQNTRFGGFDLATIFSTVRNYVLSDGLSRSIKSSLLDLMLLKAAGWVDKTQYTDSTDEDDDDDNVVDDDDDDISVEKEDSEQDWDPYGKVYAMLEKLKLEDLFKKFKDNRIRDTLLVANKEEFKKTLQEAGFPPGVILEIQMFLDKGEQLPERKKNTGSNKAVQQQSRNTNNHKHSNSEQPSTEDNIDKREKQVHQGFQWLPPHKTQDYQPNQPAFHEHDSNTNRRVLTYETEQQQHNLQDERRIYEQQRNLQEEQEMLEQQQALQDVRRLPSHDPQRQQTLHTERQMPELLSLQNLTTSTHGMETNDVRIPLHEPERVQPQQEDDESLSPHDPDMSVQDVDEQTPTSVEQKRLEPEETKGNIIDAHNLFEPSYLSRPPPLRVEPVSYEYEPEQESPGNDGPMSYSAVLKAKNEEPFPEPPSKTMSVKLTSLTKTTASDNLNSQNKQTLGKVASKETGKDTRQIQGPRPPPGLPPLPPQNWGQSTELRLTVLPNARQRKPEDNTSMEQEVWRGRLGFDSPPRPSFGRGSSPRGRQDSGRGMSRGNNEWPGTSEPVAWRRMDLGGRGEERVARPFGPGGQKACFTCGSREHMSCNDRSKLFF